MLIIFSLLLLFSVGRKYITSAYHHLFSSYILLFACRSWAQDKHVTLMFLFILSLGSVDGLRFETKTIGVGDALTLTCPRQKSESYRYLFWMRFISGSLPEVLGGTYAIDYEDHKPVNNNSHFTTKKEQNDFVLQIHRTQLSDTGFYYCITVKQRHMTFIKRIFLTIKGKNLLK